jgi:hypothetical protein
LDAANAADDWPAVQRILQEGIDTGQAAFESSAPVWESFNESWLQAQRLVAQTTLHLTRRVIASKTLADFAARGTVRRSRGWIAIQTSRPFARPPSAAAGNHQISPRPCGPVAPSYRT